MSVVHSSYSEEKKENINAPELLKGRHPLTLFFVIITYGIIVNGIMYSISDDV